MAGQESESSDFYEGGNFLREFPNKDREESWDKWVYNEKEYWGGFSRARV